MDCAVGFWGVGIYLPERRVSAAELGIEFRLERGLIENKLGAFSKPVAQGPDEHPSDMAVEAARRCLERTGLGVDDVSLVLSVGVSRDYGGGWNLAMDAVRRLGLRRAVGYEIVQGCAALATAVQIASATAGHTLIVCAERWSQTLSPTVSFPLAWLAHGDGASACLMGPGAPLQVHPVSWSTAPEFNSFMLIPAGGTREPASHDTVERNRHYRTVYERGEGDIGDTYVRCYRDAARGALAAVGAEARQLKFVVLNQLRPDLRQRIAEGLQVHPAALVETYREIGHIGCSDVALGLRQAAREARLTSGLGLVACSSVSCFGAFCVQAHKASETVWKAFS